VENPEVMAKGRKKWGRRISFCLATAWLLQLVTGCTTTAPAAGNLANPAARRAATTGEGDAFQPPDLTPTPFQPIANPVAPDRSQSPTAQPTANIPPQETPFVFYGIDFSNHKKWVSLQIQPDATSINLGKPIMISFIPGQRCNFGDHHACVNTFTTQENGTVIFITVHSGVGGEGQRFRNALEGTGINRAAFPLQRVQANLKALLGAGVALAQGANVVGGLKLVAVARIPASSLATYFDTPLDQALALAASTNPGLLEGVDPGQPQLIFETCGWKMPGEPWAAGVSSTTGSIYLGVVQKAR
jgi:hypothetical protein